MKKNFIFVLAGFFIMTVLIGCTKWEEDYEWQEGDFSLEVSVDKTDVSLGDEIEVTAVFRNLSGRNLRLSIFIYNWSSRVKAEDIIDIYITNGGVAMSDFFCF